MTLYGEGSEASSTIPGERPTQSSGERRTSPSEGEELRRSAGSGMLIGDPQVRGAMLALPTASSGRRRTHPSALRRERHAHR